MSKSASVIEINGNSYDSVTGQLVGAVNKITKQTKSPTSGGSIDGFARRAHVINAAQAVHKRAQHSQTLMRTAVKRPPKAVQSLIEKRSGRVRNTGLDPLRVSRAHATPKSHKVSRFGHRTSKPAELKNNNQVAVGEVVNERPGDTRHAKKAAVAKPMPSLVTSASHQQLERLLDLALVRADAHKRPPLATDKDLSVMQRIKLAPKWLSLGAGLLAVIIIAGFFAWQDVPQVAMKVAAARARVDASVPGYVPSGFGFIAPVKYSDGSVTVKYQDEKDSAQSFELTQAASNMDSASLVSTTVPRNTQTQTSQVNGTTVYIYGLANNAVWVNHGVAYTIKDNANLNSDQLLRIAGSL